MLEKDIEVIIVNYFTNSASKEEIAELSNWMSKKSNKLIFKDFVKANYLLDISMINFNTEEEKEKVLSKILQKEKSIQTKKFVRTFKYAAVFLIFIGLGFLYKKLNNTPQQSEKSVIVNSKVKILPGTNQAILTLENGSEVVLGQGGDLHLNGRSLNDEKLTYHLKPISTGNSIQFNYLTIPRGGQFFVQLSDGTRVWLNSDSKLKYPVSFIYGQTRKVELVYGEAYFEVSKSTDHNGDSFKVQSGAQEIEVLGTEFNVKAYKDDSHIVTTLVEGKVTIGDGVAYKYLKPSEQSIFDIENHQISVQKVDKVFDEIAWKDGYFCFKRKSMKDIMKVLSRWYNIEYVFKNTNKENKSFTGVLDRESTIDEILTYIQKTNEINFKITNRTVIIE